MFPLHTCVRLLHHRWFCQHRLFAMGTVAFIVVYLARPLVESWWPSNVAMLGVMLVGLACWVPYMAQTAMTWLGWAGVSQKALNHIVFTTPSAAFQRDLAEIVLQQGWVAWVQLQQVADTHDVTLDTDRSIRVDSSKEPLADWAWAQRTLLFQAQEHAVLADTVPVATAPRVPRKRL